MEEHVLRYAVAPIIDVDVRDSSDSQGWWTMSGYAAVFSEETTLYDGKFFKVTEEISPEFFDRVLREQPLGSPAGVVHFNMGHDMNTAVAATDVPSGQPGSLVLKADKKGLNFLAKVPKDDPDGVRMAVKMRSGVIRQASFAFTVNERKIEIIESEEERDVEHWTLVDCKHLYDVCATPQGAYPQTVAGLRSLAHALGQPVEGDPFHRQPTLTTSSASSSNTGDGTTASPTGETDENATTSTPARDKAAASIARHAKNRELFKKRG